MDIKRKIIYLDQFAGSIMSEESPKEHWGEAKELLLKAYSENKIICPIPLENFIETVERRSSEAIKENNFIISLSGNKCFKCWEEIVVGEIINIVKGCNKEIIPATYLMDRKPSMDLKNEVFLRNVKTAKAEYEKCICKEKRDINTFRDMIKACGNNAKDYYPGYMEKALISIFAKKYESFFLDVVNGSYELPDLLSFQYPKKTLLGILLKQSGMCRTDFLSIANIFKNYGFETIPSLNTYYKLEAKFAADQSKEIKNDDIDLKRISSGIAISDIMFVDSKQKRRLQSLKLDSQYNTILFSDLQGDVVAFVDILRNLMK